MGSLYYAIRVKGTDRFLPSLQNKGGKRNATSMEPVSDLPPRLFKKKHHADTSLGWWLEGITRNQYIYDNGMDGDGGDWELVTRPALHPRREEDMEVVTVRLFIENWKQSNIS